MVVSLVRYLITLRIMLKISLVRKDFNVQHIRLLRLAAEIFCRDPLDDAVARRHKRHAPYRHAGKRCIC